jgi:hypothetical protein
MGCQSFFGKRASEKLPQLEEEKGRSDHEKCHYGDEGQKYG